MIRVPVQTTTPHCLGKGEDTALYPCADCKHRERCNAMAIQYLSYWSVRERAQQLRDARGEVKGTSLRDVYVELYRRIFGKTPKHADTASTAKQLADAAEQARQAGVPFEVWVNHNMHGMKPVMDKGNHKYGFQPNMLVGERAKIRVNVSAKIARRQGAQEGIGALDRINRDRMLEDKLIAEETAIASCMFMQAIRGYYRTFQWAVEREEPTKLWHAFDRIRRQGRAETLTQDVLNGKRSAEMTLLNTVFDADAMQALIARVPVFAIEGALARIDPKLPDHVALLGTDVNAEHWDGIVRYLMASYSLDRVETEVIDAYRPGVASVT